MDINNYYIEKGEGFPLVLLHGNGENHEYFINQIEFFSSSYRVIALDTRGHGKTPRGEREFTIAQFADDLFDFFNEHKIQKAHILGFSDGANIAMKFALKYPELVGKLILNGGNLFPSGVKSSVQLPIEIGYRIAKASAAKSDKAKRNAEMLGLMVNDPFIAPEDLKNIISETLVIAGTKDLIRKEHTALIADSISNSRLRFVKGDHFVANKNHVEFNAVVDEFLK